MKIEIYSEGTHRLLFTLFDSTKKQKTNAFRVHHHPELEFGYISGGSGDYILEQNCYRAEAGDLFLVRPNEQHCVPTIFTPELSSFNIYMTSYYLWNVCGEYVEPGRLKMLIGGGSGESAVEHRFPGRGDTFLELIKLCSSPESADLSRYRIRQLVLELVISVASELPGSYEEDSLLMSAVVHQNDIQNAIGYINENLTEQLTLDDIARSAGMSRSHFSTVFRRVTGISPYEYLLLQRIERAVGLLRKTDITILEVAQSCGFRNLANFNKTFKKVTSMTPSDYRASKR